MTNNARNRLISTSRHEYDVVLLVVVTLLLLTGCIMVFSSSLSIADKTIGDPFYYIVRHLSHIALALFVSAVVFFIPISSWEKMRYALVLMVFVLLVLVLIPGVGREINGSSRWLGFGPINFQPSELAKLITIIFMAGYINKFKSELKSGFSHGFKALLVVFTLALLLLVEPDMGAAIVIVLTSMALLFLVGLQYRYVVALILSGFGLLSLLVVYSPYRLARLTAFMDPWADPFDSGFQLTQALIAFGRGDWLGAGVGGSVQKLFYLPEAHTDFLLAVLAEETGFIGVLIIIVAFMALVYRGLQIGLSAELKGHVFKAYLAYGISIWIGLQAFINIGVNMGLLPTKGITLPLLSYGGSSMLVTAVSLSILFRIHYEVYAESAPRKKSALVW